MALAPESLFCKILQYQYENKISQIESILFLPLKGIRDIKSNILRVENLVYSTAETELLSIETLLLEILILDKINLLASVDNFCQIAFSCEKLVETLIDSSNGYLTFLDPNIRSQVSADYNLFEKYVCVLGLRNIVGTFTNDMLAKLRTRLVNLRNYLEDNLRLDDMQEIYYRILERSGIFTMLNDLKKYLRCGFAVCNFAATANNKISDYVEKLSLVETTTSAGWSHNIDSLLGKYNSLNNKFTNKIDELILIIDNRGFDRNIPRDEIMIL